MDGRVEIGGYGTVHVESEEPGKDGCCWEEELGGGARWY